MTPALKELLFKIRQDPAFRELLEAVELPGPRKYRPGSDTIQQYADHVYRSGMQRGHEAWREFLIGEPPSEQEKS